MRVVVAEDRPLARAALARVAADAGLEVAATADGGSDVLRKVHAHGPDVVVMGIRDGQDDAALAALGVLRGEMPHVGVVLISERVHPRFVAALLDHAAEGAGYVLEGRIRDVAELVDAIHRLADGGSALDSDVVAHVVARTRRPPQRTLDGLPERDREVLAQMAQGASNGAIARRLFLSERSIQRHVTAIFATLGLTDSRDGHRRVLAVLAHRCAAPPSR